MTTAINEIAQAYQWLYGVLNCMRLKKPLPIDEINLVGGRRSAKSVSIEILAVWACSLLNTKSAWYFCRASMKDTKELYNEIKQVTISLGVEAKFKTNEITIGDNKIHIIGMNSQKKNKAGEKSGLANAGMVDYIVTVYEEAYQFDEQDKMAISEAVRSHNTKVEMLEVNICNPWSKSADFIQYCAKWFEWDVKQLQDTGSQFKRVDIPLGDGLYKRAVFQYTNWRVARDYLSIIQIKRIKDTWNKDKERARVVDLGLPGYEQGAIYTHLIHHLKPCKWVNHINLRGGLDWGWGTQKNSSRTAAIFLGATMDIGGLTNGIDIYNIYVTDNREQQRPNNVVYNEIVDFFLKSIDEWKWKTGYSGATPFVQVRVDYQNEAVRQSLNDVCYERNVHYILQFVKASKKILIQDRVEVTKFMMSLNMLRVEWERRHNLIRELEFATWDETDVQKRKKENDDVLNAFEYAIEPDMIAFARCNENTLDLTKSLKSKAFRR